MLFPPLHPSGGKPSKHKSSVQWCPSNPRELNSLSYSIHNPLQCRQYHLFLAVLCPGSVSPLFQSQSPLPFPEPSTGLAGTFTFFDIPASRQLQFFPFQLLLIFEALISEMYGIIGLYHFTIYLCLSLCSGLILFFRRVSTKMLPLLLFGCHNSSRSPGLLGIAAPRNFVLR